MKIDVTAEDGFFVFKNNGLDVWDFRRSDVEKVMPELKEKRWFTPIVEMDLMKLIGSKS